MSARLRLCSRLLGPALIGICVLPSLAAADGPYVPGISPPLPYPRPSYRETYNDFPPGHYGGGFVEYVMSGGQRSLFPRNDAAPPVSAMPLAAPAPYGAPVYATPVYAAPQPVYAPAPTNGALPRGGLPEYAPNQPQAYYRGRQPGYSAMASQGSAPQGALPFAQPVAPQVAYGAPGEAYDPLRADPSLASRALDPAYARQMVAYSGPGRPGTIVVDTPHKFLYLVRPGGQAIRYGIGVGRPGFTWSGVKTITRKAEWPGWTPPRTMLARRPDLPRHMEGGEANPLGARALYLGTSEYRIHGTNEPYTIGTNVSSGCIRMMNQDVMDLYSRVGIGTRVVVM